MAESRKPLSSGRGVVTTPEEKVAKYEEFLFMIHKYYQETPNKKEIQKLLDNASNWAYWKNKTNAYQAEKAFTDLTSLYPEQER